MNQVSEKKPPYLMILILMMGSFIALLNNSLLNNALPTIRADFNIKDYSTVQWLTTGYMLVMGILIPTSAFLITRFKNKHLFITAMTTFSVGTLMAAAAPSFDILLAGRLIQAAGASTLSPLLMNIMLVSFPKEKRGMVMGIYGLIIITGPALGPTISGYILEHYNWRFLFVLIAPLAIISIVLAIWKLKNILENKEAHLDYLSVILSTIGFGGILYGFSSASTDGWTGNLVLASIGIGLIVLILFVTRQFRLKEPLLNLRVYTYPIFALGNVVTILLSIAMYSATLLLPIYMQNVRGFSPMKSGLIMLPGALLMGFMSPITGKLYDKFGPRILALVGLIITGTASYYLSCLKTDTSTAYIVGVATLRYLGLSMVIMPVMTNSLNQLPHQLFPHGSAINSTVQQVSGSLGAAIFVTLMTNQAKTKGTQLAASMKAKADSAIRAMIEKKMAGMPPKQRTALTSQQLTELKAKAASMTPHQIAEIKVHISQAALLDGINYVFTISIFIIALALVFSLFLKRKKTIHQ